jgi:cathepsin B
MRNLFVALILTICVVKSMQANIRTVPNDLDPTSQKMVDYINYMNTTWTAALNFDGVSLRYLKGLMGVHKDNKKYRLPILRHEENVEIPEAFDSRKQWPECKSISEIRDQGSCGSCWAFGAVEAMTDRICIASKGTKQFEISAEDLVSCCDSCGFGCDGGYPSAAWEYWVDSGLVTGGLYNSKQGCQPYEVKSCEHHVKGPLPPCGDIVPTPTCVHVCEKGYNVSYRNDKHFGAKAYGIASDVTQIQTEIMKNGPVEADFTVYADFPSYKSGVYQRHSDQVLGGHAIRILGWGVENSVPYWLVANSWNPDWGDKGYFKIVRGTDECGIEDDINAGLPK